MSKGLKPSVSFEERLEELQKHEIFDENGKVKKESDPIWKIICKNLGNKIKPHNLQNFVAQDRQNIKKLLSENVYLQETVLKESGYNDNINSKSENDSKVNSKSENSKELLLTLQNNVLYSSIIREICAYPFTIFHWPIQGLELLKSMPDSTMIFGAVGCFVKKFEIPDEYLSKDIILFSLGIEINQEFIPICQMSTEDNSIILFKRFFIECLRSGLRVPSKVITDYYWSHIIATSQAFNVNFTYEKYLVQCFLYLNAKTDELPACQISIDIKGIIKKVQTWNCLTDSSVHLKKFYSNVIFLLSLVKNLSEFEELLLEIFVLSSSKYENAYTKKYFNELTLKMQDLKIEIYEEECNSQQNIKDIVIFKDESVIIYEECEIIILYLKNIYFQAKHCFTNEDESLTYLRNPFFIDNIAREIMVLAVEFAAWTKVMEGHYKCVSKAFDITSIASLNIYNRNFQKTLVNFETDPPSHKEYLLKNISYVNKLLEVKNSCNNSELNSHIIESNNVNDSYLRYQENWMNLIRSDMNMNERDSDQESSVDASPESRCGESSEEENNSALNETQENRESLRAELDRINEENKEIKGTMQPAKKRGKLLELCPELHLYQQQPKKICKKRLLIKNANGLKPVKIHKSVITFTTTSIFDSLTEILVSTYYLVNKFQQFINNVNTHQSNHFLKIIREFATKLEIKVLYTERAQLMYNIGCNNKNNVYWQGSAGEFFSSVMVSNIYKKRMCLNCEIVEDDHLKCLNLSVPLILKKGFEYLKDIVLNILNEKRYCIFCNEEISSTFELKHYICLDVECDPKIQDSHQQQFINISDIPTELSIEKQNFILTGIIAFEEPILASELRHYIAYCRNFSNSWIKMDDNLPDKEFLKNKNPNIKPALIIYTEVNPSTY